MQHHLYDSWSYQRTKDYAFVFASLWGFCSFGHSCLHLSYLRSEQGQVDDPHPKATLLQVHLSKKETSHKLKVSIVLISLKNKLKETMSEIMLKADFGPSLVTVRNLHICMHVMKQARHFGS